jgi:hypothetical protein
MKHWALAAMAAAALALAGCGGGGGSSSKMPETPGPTPAQLAATASGLLDTAATAVNAVMDDSDDVTVTAADTAVAAAETAVMAASESDDHAALSQRLGTLQGSLTAKKNSRTAAMGAKDTQDAKDMTALAKALKKAIDVDVRPVVTTSSLPAFDLDGDGTGTDQSNAITLKKGDAAGSLGNWKAWTMRVRKAPEPPRPPAWQGPIPTRRMPSHSASLPKQVKPFTI